MGKSTARKKSTVFVTLQFSVDYVITKLILVISGYLMVTIVCAVVVLCWLLNGSLC